MDFFGMQHGLHHGAIGVAADDNVGDFQHRHRILNSGCAVTLHRARGATMLPAFRRIKSSPGSVCVSSVGSTRESEQVMKRARGVWFSESRVKSALFYPNTSVRNFRKPLTSFSIARFLASVYRLPL